MEGVRGERGEYLGGAPRAIRRRISRRHRGHRGVCVRGCLYTTHTRPPTTQSGHVASLRASREVYKSHNRPRFVSILRVPVRRRALSVRFFFLCIIFRFSFSCIRVIVIAVNWKLWIYVVDERIFIFISNRSVKNQKGSKYPIFTKNIIISKFCNLQFRQHRHMSHFDTLIFSICTHQL